MARLPDEVLAVFEQNTSADDIRRTRSDSIELYSGDFEIVGTEFTRQVGKELLDRGYIISGVREYNEHIEVWVDDMSDRIEQPPTLAEQAAEILEPKSNSTELVPNDSAEPKEQYVDVFPDPNEWHSDEWGIGPTEMDILRDAGIRVRCISCGRASHNGSEESYRVWFEPTDDPVQDYEQ